MWLQSSWALVHAGACLSRLSQHRETNKQAHTCTHARSRSNLRTCLHTRAPAHADFITEAPSAAPTVVQIEALGLGPNVPRCLRWTGGELLEVPMLGQQDAEVLAMEVLEVCVIGG